MDRILRINMGSKNGPSIKIEELGEFTGLGGRGLTSAIVSKEVPPLCHPLSGENKLVIAPGLLSGTAGVMSGRISIGCKSPLTGGIIESNAGGQSAQVLARLGYAAIVIEGKPEGDDLYKIVITNTGIQITSDNNLKNLSNYDVIKKVNKEYGDKVACLSIGQAGEMKMSAASIAITDIEQRPTRHAGRGGVGAVMGSKKVKLIILDDTGCKMRQPKNPDKFEEANKKFAEGLNNHPVTGKALPAYGTNVLTNIINEAGGYPAYNFRDAQFENAHKISGEVIAELEEKRGASPTHACHRGCIIKCSGVFNDKNGKYLTKQPEFEMVWAHGAHCGIDDIDKIAEMDFLENDIGIDTIEMGVTLGIAMDAGIIKFGDADGAIKLIKEVAKGTHLGRILGNGASVTAKVFGVVRVPVVKGQALPAYDPRAIQGIGITYATSPMGADYTSGYIIATNILNRGGDVDTLKLESQIEFSRNIQTTVAAIDSTGLCSFIAFAILDQPETFQAMLNMISSFYDSDITAESVNYLGKRIIAMEREFNEKAGLNKQHDRLPKFFINEPLAPHNKTFIFTDEELDSVFDWEVKLIKPSKV